jgi:D-alanyl-D-alanine carboxypeptidase/D-alanyl-D-alanine-endopeptidase (penicillin-binding protein 4)
LAALAALSLSLGQLCAADQLARDVEQFVDAPPRNRATIGVHVVALRSGRVIYSRHGMRQFICASNEKIVTAAAALEALGHDYCFETRLYALGPVENGSLHGDLVLHGGGDPTLGGRHDQEEALTIFGRWADILKARGIRQVTGDVIADPSFFDRTYYHPDWSPTQAWKWYFPSIAAVALNDNCVTVTVKPAHAAGALARVSLTPSSTPVEVQNLCKTSGSRHSVWFDRRPESGVIKVGGYCRAGSDGYSGEVTVPDPPLYAARVLREALQEKEVAVGGTARVADEAYSCAFADRTPICVRRTSLLPVLRTMLKQSHNHYAEQVMKTIGAETAGLGSWETGTGRAGRLLCEMGFNENEFNLADGSGLSRQNRLTPVLLAAVLEGMTRSEYADVFPSLLAVAGQDGTLARRLREEPYVGNVRGKTGYLTGVGALSGYATTRSGIEVAFSILVNDNPRHPGGFSMRETVDTICRAIVDHAE